jgi:mRNA-degrading endonuclease RelE of RelBE toxin-antitoxin system
VTWRVFVRGAAEADFERLDPSDQQVVSAELFTWVDQGPPRQTRRDVLGVEMFDDVVAGSYRIVYFVDEGQQSILVVTIRRRPS